MAQHLHEDVQVEGSSHSPSADTASVVATPAIVANKCRITDWADSIDASTVKQLYSLIGEAFFTGGVPFRFIENSALKKFVKAMRPSYELPSRHRLCNDILDDTHDSVKMKMTEAVRRGKYVSIATDAWTDVNGQSVVNYFAMMPHPIFFKAIYTKDNSHTADYLARTTAAVIEEIGAEKVVAVLTDNAAPNRAAWKMQQQEFRSSNLTCIGCAAHWLNLMAKEMLKLDVFKDVLGETVQMIKFFKNKHSYSTAGWRKHSEACTAQLFHCKRRQRGGG